MPNRVLVLFSGGIESTSLLKYLLLNTTDVISAVHVYAPNSVNRAEVEAEAVNNLYPHLCNIREFSLDHICVDIPWDTRDAELHSGLIPAMMKGTRSSQFYRGLCREDWDTGTHDHGKRRLIGRQVAGWMGNEAMWETISPDLPHLWLTKQQHMDYLGDLVPLTWSCLTPIHPCGVPIPCGRCSTCILRNENVVFNQQEN